MTERYLICSICSGRKWASGLFDALRDMAQGKQTLCSKCGPNAHRLELIFPLALAPTARYKVVHAFLPKKPDTWRRGKSKIQFYPFLVLLESLNSRHRSVWLPYWHAVTNDGRTRMKYGQ